MLAIPVTGGSYLCDTLRLLYSIDQDSLDVAPEGKPPPQLAKSSENLLAVFDTNAAKARAAIASASGADLFKPWSLMNHSTFTGVETPG